MASQPPSPINSYHADLEIPIDDFEQDASVIQLFTPAP